MSGRLRIILAFCLSIVILGVTGIYSYRNTNEYKSASEWVTHTQMVIAEAGNVLLGIQDIETAERGYVITGSEKYLKPYETGLQEESEALGRVNLLVRDNPVQKLLLDSIRKKIELKLSFVKHVVDARKRAGFAEAQKLIATDIGQKLMQDIRQMITSFIGHEKRLLSERMVKEKDHFATTVFVVISNIALAILIVIVTMYFFILDHNRRIRSERKVLESELRIKKFLESIPLGVFIQGADRKPYYENDRFKRFFGRDKNPEASFPGFVSGTNTQYPHDKLPTSRALSGEMEVCIEDLEVEVDKRRIPLRINSTPVTNLENEVEYAISVYEDISDIKETEKVLTEAKKIAEQSSLLKEAFLANMSHEIRTPMNAIIGFTDLLLKKDLKSQEKDYVQTIKNSGENLLRIINDVLDVSKIDSGMMTFEEHPINIRELFNSVQTMLSEKAKTKKLNLNFEYDGNVPEMVSGDPTRLTQIIINLVGNAIKFTKQGAVSVYAKVLKEENDTYFIEFAVKDTGIGIPEDKINSIFERFRQAESHTTRNYGGTGLGLSIAKQLIELQGGKIAIRSMVDVGSVFSFTLPFKKTNEINPVKGRQTAAADLFELGKLSILIAEDNPVNVKFIHSLFSEYNISADIAENGKMAVDKLKEREYDLVLMDMEMPEMNGYEATLVIRNELKNNTPIIAMTAHAMAGEKEKCLQLGMNDYISKPIRADLLFEKMLAATVSKRMAIQETKEDNSAPARIINLDFLVRSMRGKKAVILETIGVFITQMAEDLNAMEEAVQKADYKVIRNISHRMRSTVSFMGITVMESLLEEMENLAASENGIEKLREMHASIKALSVQALNEIETEKQLYS